MHSDTEERENNGNTRKKRAIESYKIGLRK